jgi:putative ABC transport system permease protein
MWETEPSAPGGLFPVSGQDLQDWRKQQSVFEGLAAATEDGAALTGVAEPQQLQGWQVTTEMFSLLRVQPLLGRTLAADEEGRTDVVLASYGLWQGALGGDRNIVGEQISLDGQRCTVVGVMPQDFKFPHMWGRRADFWRPLSFDQPDFKKERGNHWCWVLGRLKPGISLQQAQAEMETVSGRLTQAYPESNRGVVAKVVSLREQLTRNVKPALVVLLAAVACLLLVACVNVTNLLLAKAVAREREMAIRRAVGSGRVRLVRQLLTESILLFLVGGLAGLAVGNWALKFLLRAAPAGYIPELIQVRLDLRVFAYALLIVFITGTLAGLVPALHASRTSLGAMLKEGGSVAGSHGFVRRLLTVGEIALALMMLVGAGLATRSLMRLLGVSLGFDPKQVVAGRISLPAARYPQPPQRVAFFHDLVERVHHLPGVVSAAATSELPLEGGRNGTVVIEGQPVRRDMWSSPLVESCFVTPRYFETVRIPLLSGRDVAETDTPDTPSVAVINETMARRFWPHQDALGKRFRYNDPDAKWITVVGVAGDVREFDLAQPPTPEAYYPESQLMFADLVLVVRTANDPLAQVPAIRKTLAGVDSALPWYRVQPVSDLVAGSSHQKRFLALLLALFAGVALALAAVGIYGVVSYSVSQRTREIGIRMAFGARVRDVLGMVFNEGARLTAGGVAAGMLGAWALSRYLGSLLYGVRPTDLLTYALAGVLLTLVGLAACLLPARRAARVDPMVALRHE